MNMARVELRCSVTPFVSGNSEGRYISGIIPEVFKKIKKTEKSVILWKAWDDKDHMTYNHMLHSNCNSKYIPMARDFHTFILAQLSDSNWQQAHETEKVISKRMEKFFHSFDTGCESFIDFIRNQKEWFYTLLIHIKLMGLTNHFKIVTGRDLPI